MSRRLTHALAALPAVLAALPAQVFTALPAQAQAAAQRPEYWQPDWDWGWGHMIYGSVMMIVFWAGIILLIVLAFRWLGGGRRQETGQGTQAPPPGTRALEILQERFARGEIDKDEFEERKRYLSE